MPGDQDGNASLRDLLRHGPALEPAWVSRVAAGIAGELASVHARRSAHGAVCPEAVEVNARTGRVRLFSAGDSSPAYLAPEHAGAPHTESGTGTTAVSTAGDLYSLGVIVYEMCCGLPPCEVGARDAEALDTGGGADSALAGAHPEFVRPFRPEGIPEPLWCVIECLLDPDPSHRPAGADEVGARLAVLAHTLIDDEPAPRLDSRTAPIDSATADPVGENGSEPERIFVLSSDDEPRRRRRAPRRPPWASHARPRMARLRVARPRVTRPRASTSTAAGPPRRTKPPTPNRRASTQRPPTRRAPWSRRVTAAALALLGVTVFGITWLVGSSLRDYDSPPPARVQVEPERPEAGPVLTIEPAQLQPVGGLAGRAGAPPP